jgi:nucleoside-diphosphate-sugar epimerase
MNILVTGGAGFLGRHTAAKLLDHRHRVYLLGRSFDRDPATLQALLKRGAVPVIADLRDRGSVAAACKGMDAVVHAGALSADWGARAEFEAVNVGGTQHVIDGCHAAGVGRLVHISTPAVIFAGEDHENADERWPSARTFTSHYAATKLAAEQLVNAAWAGGLPSVILRPKAIFGPGDTSLLPRLLGAARAGRLRQFGRGDNRVDITYVENVAHAILLAVEARAAVGKTYFITNDEHVLLWPLIRRVLHSLHLPHDLQPLPIPMALGVARLMEWRANLTGRPPLLTRYSVGVLARTQTYNVAAARRDLGYAPVIPVEQGINHTLTVLRTGHSAPITPTAQPARVRLQ